MIDWHSIEIDSFENWRSIEFDWLHLDFHALKRAVSFGAARQIQEKQKAKKTPRAKNIEN